MDLIDDFLKHYAHEYDFYFEAAKRAAAVCELGLEQNGIRAIVTYRAKRTDRLKAKLVDRNQRKKYVSENDIVNDIVDLAGVRIELYFPGDREAVRKLVANAFDVSATKEFAEPKDAAPSYKKRFSGYWATHYRVRLKESGLDVKDLRYIQALVEIQVASVLMHAWAEVEHDLIYKPSTGKLSDAEYAILDQLNGLVLAGEVGLEQLQTAIVRRVEGDSKKFENHYELAAFLYDMLMEKYPDKKDEPIIGRTDLLLKFLRLAKRDTAQAIGDYVTRLHPDTEKRPLVDQLVDIMIAGNASLYEVYRKAQEEVTSTYPVELTDRPKQPGDYEQALGFFMSRWIALELVLGNLAERSQEKERKPLLFYNVFRTDAISEVSEAQRTEIQALRRLRNTLVHGIEQPSIANLQDAGKRLEEIVEDLLKRMPPIRSKALRPKVATLLRGKGITAKKKKKKKKK